MLTPFVVALTFANSVAAACAYPYAVLMNALQNPRENTLTVTGPEPSRALSVMIAPFLGQR
jgi:hypothetical protein